MGKNNQEKIYKVLSIEPGPTVNVQSVREKTEMPFAEGGRRKEMAGGHCSLLYMEGVSLHHWRYCAASSSLSLNQSLYQEPWLRIYDVSTY